MQFGVEEIDRLVSWLFIIVLTLLGGPWLIDLLFYGG